MRHPRRPHVPHTATVTALPGAPLVPATFWDMVRRESGRAVEVEPRDLPPGAPSGVWCRTAGTDYLFYEAQTSPFHQLHIQLCLAAQVLLSSSSSTVDPRLVPGLDPRLVRLILGDDAQLDRQDEEAETLAVLTVERASHRPSARVARRLLRQVQPLREALLAAVPQARHPAGMAGPQRGPRVGLHRAVVEIRDAVLALRPYWDERVVEEARRDAAAAGLGGAARAAAVEASVLGAAVRARAAGRAAGRPGAAREWQCWPRPELDAEAAWLGCVARAFGRGVPARHPAGEGPRPVPRPAGGGWGMGRVEVALGSRMMS
jgi:Family of unknown function (DUF6545)